MANTQTGQEVGGGVQALMGGLAGLLPGGTTSGTQNQTNSGWTDQSSNQNTFSNFNQQLQSLLNSLTSTSGSTGSASSTSSTTNPNLSPQTQSLIDSLTKRYQNLTAPALTGYAAQQTQGINQNANLQQQAAAQMMASRGLSGSPAAGTTAANIDAQRFGAVTNMQEGLPVLQNQMNVANLGAAANFMNMIPHGTTTTGTSIGSTTNQQDTTGQQTQDQTSTGSTVGGQTAWSGGTSGSTSTGSSTSQKGGSLSSGLAGAAGGIASLLAGLFSDERLKKDIKPIDKALDKIMSLRPVGWKWRGGSELEDSGLLAQDVAKKLPELVDKTDTSGFLKVNYAGLIGTLVGAIQELATETN